MISPFEQQNASAGGSERVRKRAATGTAADDDDVVPFGSGGPSMRRGFIWFAQYREQDRTVAEPSRRHFVPELSADPLSSFAEADCANPAAVLARAGVDDDEVSDADKKGLAAAAPEIVAAVKRLLDGVRDGELRPPAPAEPVAAARTGSL